MFLQMTIPLIQQQDRRRARSMAGSHIVNAIPDLSLRNRQLFVPSVRRVPQPWIQLTHHNQILRPIRQPPLPRNMQNPRRVRLGKQIGRVAGDDGEEDMTGEVILDEILHRGSGLWFNLATEDTCGK